VTVTVSVSLGAGPGAWQCAADPTGGIGAVVTPPSQLYVTDVYEPTGHELHWNSCVDLS